MAFATSPQLKKPTMPPTAVPTTPPGATVAAPVVSPPKPTMPTPPMRPAPPSGMLNNAAPGGPPPGVPPAPPTPPPAAPPPVAPTGTVEQQDTARQPPGTFPDDDPDAGQANTGDPYLDELRSGRVAGSEDWRRFSNAQLKAWQPFYVGNGKFKNKYGDIVDKPPDRGPNTPPGMNGWGDPMGAGGGGGGGRGGRGGRGGLPGRPPGEMAGASDTIWQAILGRLNGASRYSPEAMQSIMGALKGQAENQAAGQTEAANADLAARGLARSSIGANQQLQIRAGVGQSMQQAQAGMMKAKIDADFEDKTAAIDEGLKWLDSLRNYTASMAATEAQKAAAMANIQLGYAQLRQQMDYLRESYAQDLTKIGLGY